MATIWSDICQKNTFEIYIVILIMIKIEKKILVSQAEGYISGEVLNESDGYITGDVISVPAGQVKCHNIIFCRL